MQFTLNSVEIYDYNSRKNSIITYITMNLVFNEITVNNYTGINLFKLLALQ